MTNTTSTATTLATDPQANPDLQTLHDSLIALVAQLADAIGTAPDSDTVDAITTEISEVNHRVNLVGNLLFTQQSAKITTKVQNVTDATSDVEKDISQIASATDAVKTMTGFLVLVDKAIDTAKLVGAAIA